MGLRRVSHAHPALTVWTVYVCVGGGGGPIACPIAGTVEPGLPLALGPSTCCIAVSVASQQLPV